jgi:fatty-acyl-CoA synthase
MFVPLTPIRCLYRGVDLYGPKVGVVCGSRRFTYAQFGERCERLAFGLQKEGVQPGERVAFLSFNTHQLLEGYFGPILARAIAMPLNVRLTQVELTEILNHAEASVLVFEKDFAPLVEAFRQSCPSIRRFVSTDQAAQHADISYEELLSHGRLDRPDLFSVDENEMAELFYTSGSTGAPKGVALSHRTLYLHALSTGNTIREDEDSVNLHTIPLFHANGWGKPQSSTMMGSTQVMVRRFDPAKVLELIQQERATCMLLVPVMANALLNCAELGKFDTSSMQDIMLGGAASSPELVCRLEEAFHCRVFAGYGLTETSPVATTARLKSTRRYASDDCRYEASALAGLPGVGVEVRVVDSQDHTVPQDRQTVGEVVIRGDNVMDGYYREPDATAAVIKNGWLHTGDMAVWDEESCINIVDRKKDIIISGGENISSIEIERAIFAHAKVLECAVVSAPDDKWGEIPVALVVLKPDKALTAEELTIHLEARLARFKLPRQIEFVPGPLPKTGTGKILKRDLREAFWAGKAKRVQGG